MKALISSLAVCAALLASPAMSADEAYVLKPGHKMEAVLKDLAGKRVTLRLRAGGELTGKVAVVGDHAVQLSALANKEFYDAIISLDAIDAVEVKARSQ